MPITAQSADGATHEFPDDTKPEVVDRVMKTYAQTQKKPEAPTAPAGPDLASLPDTAPSRSVMRNPPADLDQKALFEQREKAPKGSPEYDALTKQIAQAQTGQVEGAASYLPVGTVGKGVAGAVRGAVRSAGSPAAEKLLDAAPNIRLTPGQRIGGGLKTAEDSLTSLPFTGSALVKAKRLSIEDLNRELYDRALKPIGQKFEGTEVGRNGVKEVNDKLGAAYEALKPRLTWRATGDYNNDLVELARQVKKLPPALQQQARSVYDNVIAHNMAKGGTMDGETFKKVESELGTIAMNYRSSTVASEREFGERISDMQGLLRDQLTRSNPEVAAELEKLNTAWAVLTRIQTAAARRLASGGVITPGDLSAAVKTGDKSVRKGAFARGDAMLQDLSDPAQDVLPSSVPDSGTGARMLHASSLAQALGLAGYLPTKAYLGLGRALNRAGRKGPTEFPSVILPAPGTAQDALNNRTPTDAALNP